MTTLISFRVKYHAKTRWATSVPFASAISRSCATFSKLLSHLSPWKSGFCKRKSPSANVVSFVYLPANIPEANGKYGTNDMRSEEHTSELQSRFDLVCRRLLEKKNKHVSTPHLEGAPHVLPP